MREFSEQVVYIYEERRLTYRHLMKNVNYLEGSLRLLAELIKQTVGYTGDILDASKPDGTFLKLLDVSRLSHLGWKAKSSLSESIKLTYQDFLTNPLVLK